jgi:hypothetical protein
MEKIYKYVHRELGVQQSTYIAESHNERTKLRLAYRTQYRTG